MNFCEYFIFAGAASLIFYTQQSNCLELSLCLGETINNECQNSKNTVANSNDYTANKNKDPTDANSVLTNGFSNFNTIVTAAEKKISDGFLLAYKLLTTQPKAAAQVVQEAIQNAQDTFDDAGPFVFLAMGEASSFCDDTVRQELGDANQKLQLVTLELLNIIRTAIILLNQAISNGGGAVIQVIELLLQAAFTALHYETDICYQKSIAAVSVPQCQRRPMQCQGRNQNPDVTAKDSDTVAFILQINKAADDSINKGADPCLVNGLRLSLIAYVIGLTEIATHVNDYVAYIKKLAETDPLSAKNIYLAESKGVCKRIQEIFANICLDFGVAAAKSDDSTKKQIRNAIKTTALGNNEIVTGNKIAKHFTLLALLFEDNVRKTSLSAAAQSGNFGIITQIKRIIEAAKIALIAFSK